MNAFFGRPVTQHPVTATCWAVAQTLAASGDAAINIIHVVQNAELQPIIGNLTDCVTEMGSQLLLGQQYSQQLVVYKNDFCTPDGLKPGFINCFRPGYPVPPNITGICTDTHHDYSNAWSTGQIIAETVFVTLVTAQMVRNFSEIATRGDTNRFFGTPADTHPKTALAWFLTTSVGATVGLIATGVFDAAIYAQSQITVSNLTKCTTFLVAGALDTSLQIQQASNYPNTYCTPNGIGSDYMSCNEAMYPKPMNISSTCPTTDNSASGWSAPTLAGFVVCSAWLGVNILRGTHEVIRGFSRFYNLSDYTNEWVPLTNTGGQKYEYI